MCDFKLYHRKRQLNEIFTQALKRLIILQKQERSQVKKHKEKRDNKRLRVKMKQDSVVKNAIENIVQDRMEHFEIGNEFDVMRVVLNANATQISNCYEKIEKNMNRA